MSNLNAFVILLLWKLSNIDIKVLCSVRLNIFKFRIWLHMNFIFFPFIWAQSHEEASLSLVLLVFAVLLSS